MHACSYPFVYNNTNSLSFASTLPISTSILFSVLSFVSVTLFGCCCFCLFTFSFFCTFLPITNIVSLVNRSLFCWFFTFLGFCHIEFCPTVRGFVFSSVAWGLLSSLSLKQFFCLLCALSMRVKFPISDFFHFFSTSFAFFNQFSLPIPSSSSHPSFSPCSFLLVQVFLCSR